MLLAKLFSLLVVSGEPALFAEAASLTSGQKLALTPCDCGVLWENLGTVQSISNIANTGSYYGFGVHILSWTSPETNTTSLYLPVLNVDQAMHRCYNRIDCHGFVYDLSSGAAPFRAYFYDYTVVSGQTFATSPQLSGISAALTEVFNLTRSELYRCPSFDLDYYFYYFSDATRRTEIEQAFCPNYLTSNASCCWNFFNGAGVAPCYHLNPVISDPLLNTDFTWKIMAQLHWVTYGNKLRYPPNSGCTLTPTLWDASSKCVSETTGCFTFAGVPCGKRGYCTANTGALASPWYRDPDNGFVASGPLYTTPNYCSCVNYTGGNFDDVPIYYGHSCEVRSFEVCAQPGNLAAMCSGGNVNCLPRLLSLTAPNNDYTAQCYCDADPPWPGTGTYCENSRCVPGGGACGIDGSCVRVHTSPDVWQCQCGLSTVGLYCQFSSAGCRLSDPTLKCKGRGTCYPPGLPPDNATYPNFDPNNAWCACPSSSFFGSNCQFERCDPSENVVPGHGRCSDTGLFVSCYTPYTSSNSPAIRCDVDQCNATGGVVTLGLVTNPLSGGLESVPADCDCGGYLHGSGSDITCYPRCGNGTTGVLCGTSATLCSSIIQTPICQRTTVGSSRFAECVCGPGMISVPAPSSTNNLTVIHPPTGKNKTVCEPWCKHGCVTLSWVYPQQCNCVPNIDGFDIGPDEHGVMYPRCDHPTCAHNGIWNSGTQRCTCVGPYSSSTKCLQNTCDDPNTAFVEGAVIPDPLHPSTNEICQCNGPFRSSDATLQDCAINTCGDHGFINPSLTDSTPPASMCVCTGGFITICSDFSGLTCAFCASVGCQNGGVLHIQNNINVCACEFPWQGDTYCFTSLCGPHSISLSGLCACTDGFSGPLCLTPPCINGNWSEILHKCICDPHWNGTTCSRSVFSSDTFSPSHSSSSSSSSSTAGTAASSSSSGLLMSSSALSSSSSSASSVLSSNSSSSSPLLSTGGIIGVSVGGVAFVGVVVLIVLGAKGMLGGAAVTAPVVTSVIPTVQAPPPIPPRPIPTPSVTAPLLARTGGPTPTPMSGLLSNSKRKSRRHRRRKEYEDV